MLGYAGASAGGRSVHLEAIISKHFSKFDYISDFQLRNLDPFLMLDEFRVTRPAGFPDHPHRGFETASIHS